MSEQPIGPSLPPNWERNDNYREDDIIGPALPPNFHINTTDDPILATTRTVNSGVQKKVIGPEMPIRLKSFDNSRDKESDDESDHEMVGPLPADVLDKRYEQSIANRSNKRNEANVAKREEWMTVIPKSLGRKLGMKSVTSFSRKSTAEPKRDANTTERSVESSERDAEMSRLMDSHQKNKRQASLLEIHSENRKKIRSERSESETPERVTFNPETDLAVKCLDRRQTRSVIDKAQLLNTRFSRGENKFL